MIIYLSSTLRRFQVLPAKQLASQSFYSNWFQLEDWQFSFSCSHDFKMIIIRQVFNQSPQSILIILILQLIKISVFLQRCIARSLTSTTTWRSKCSSSSSSTSTPPSSTSPSSRASSSATLATITTSSAVIWETKT